MKMTLRDIEAEVNDTMNKFLNSTIEVSASDLNLDYRAGYGLYIDADYAGAIIVEKSRKASLEYYGGFEYINRDLVSEIGDYTIYYADEESDSCRVRDAIASYDEKCDNSLDN